MKDESLLLAEDEAANFDVGSLMGAQINKAASAARKKEYATYYEAEFSTSGEKIDDIPVIPDDKPVETENAA